MLDYGLWMLACHDEDVGDGGRWTVDGERWTGDGNRLATTKAWLRSCGVAGREKYEEMMSLLLFKLEAKSL